MTFNVFTSGYPISAVPAGKIWGVDIVGATPYKIVGESEYTPWGTHPSYPNMGATDANGNYSFRGLLGSDQVGTFHSTWTVDSQPVGDYFFTVVPSDYTGPGYGIAQPQKLAPAAAAEAAPTFEEVGRTLVEKGAIGPGTAPVVVPTEPTIADLEPGAVLASATVRRRSGARPEFVGGVIAGGAAAGGPVGVIIGIIAIVGSLLGSLFGSLFGGQDWGKQIGQLRATMVNIGNAITADLNQVHRWVAKILDFLQGVYVAIIHVLVELVKKILDLLKRLVTEIIPNILKAIQDIRKKIIDVYKRIIRPLIIIIQRVRWVLAILKLFHIKWAAKLDATLAQLESKLMAPIFFLLKYVNTVANYLNLILTARLILQKGLFLNSLQAYMGSSLAMIYNAQSAPLSDADNAAIAAGANLPSVPESVANGDQYLRSGAGAYQDLGDRSNAQLLTYLQQGF